MDAVDRLWGQDDEHPSVTAISDTRRRPSRAAAECPNPIDLSHFGVYTAAMNRIEQQIQARIETFVEELSDLVKRAALDSVSQALAGTNAVAARRGGRRSKTNGAKVAKTDGRRRPGPRGPKRSPEALAKLQAALLEEIQLNPGQRMEEIGKSLGVATKDLDLLIKKLIAGKRIKKRGKTRATTYFAA